MQFMKNSNIKRTANDVLIDTHKKALKSLSSHRQEYSQELLITWLKQEHDQLIGGDSPEVEGKNNNDFILEVLTEITVARVIKKLKWDPPQTVKDYKLIDDLISKNIHLFDNFKDYLDKKIRTSYN